MPAPNSQASQSKPQLVPLPVDAPGSLGLYLQAQQAVLTPKYCIEASNCIVDQFGRIAARNGRTTITNSAASGQVRSIFEYLTSTGQSTSIVGFDGGISSSLTAPSGSSLVGTITSVASGRWFFQNFFNKCIGFQAGQKPIVMQSPIGTFSNIVESSGSAPQGGVGFCGLGRVWGMAADGFTLQWCALGDETNWAAGDSGSIDLRKVWPKGMDTVTAIAAFGQRLVIFGLRQILMYGSADATVLDLDVTQIQIIDTIENVGCISQWTVAHVGGEEEQSDLLFCSQLGIQSLQRLVLISGSHPIQQLSKKCRDAIVAQLSGEASASAISGYYSPTNGFYALSLPTNQYTWIADMRHTYEDEDGDLVCRMTRWPFGTTAMVEFAEGANTRANYFASSTTGKVVQYVAGGGDDAALYTVTLQLPWMDLGQDYASRLKALKRVGALLYSASSRQVTFTWYADFSANAVGSKVLTTTGGTGAQWGIAQWGIDQWGGAGLLTLLYANASGQGQYFSLAISTSSDSNFAIQQASLLAKLLRLA